MITLSRYRGIKAEIDPETDQKLIAVPRKIMKRGNDLFISKDGVFYVSAWQIFNSQETAGFYQISPEEARDMIKLRQGEMSREQRGAAERLFPGVFG
jgi:hypothetical protein